jgi:hypothetical protein
MEDTNTPTTPDLNLTPVEIPTTPLAPVPVRVGHNKRQQFLLFGWLAEHIAEAENLTDAALAIQAAKDLGFDITPTNLQTSREAAGIEKYKEPEVLTLDDRVNRLEAAFRRFEMETGREITFPAY